jgi:AraC-like DNA-binding protein
MDYRQYDPSPAASSFLTCFWTLETDSLAVQRIVPDGRPELIIHLGERFEYFRDGTWRLQPRRFLAGQITRPLLIRPTGAGKVLAARFHPNGAARICKRPMEELTDRFLPLDIPASTPEELEAALLKRLRPGNWVVEKALATIGDGQGHISDLAAELRYSRRSIQRVFQRDVGIPPKLYARIQRFQRVFREYQAGRKWIETAIECGYYDQSHLAVDFRQFAGEAPAALIDGGELARHLLSHSSYTPPPTAL